MYDILGVILFCLIVLFVVYGLATAIIRFAIVYYFKQREVFYKRQLGIVDSESDLDHVVDEEVVLN